jgi:hypothetical protein
VYGASKVRIEGLAVGGGVVSKALSRVRSTEGQEEAGTEIASVEGRADDELSLVDDIAVDQMGKWYQSMYNICIDG